MGASQSIAEIENKIKKIDEKITELTTKKEVLEKEIKNLSPPATETESPERQLSAEDVEQLETENPGETIGGKKTVGKE